MRTARNRFLSGNLKEDIVASNLRLQVDDLLVAHRPLLVHVALLPPESHVMK